MKVHYPDSWNKNNTLCGKFEYNDDRAKKSKNEVNCYQCNSVLRSLN